jgi:hypothetical protein
MFKWQADINVKTGGQPVKVEVFANNYSQACKIIEMRPEFKSFQFHPTEVKQ